MEASTVKNETEALAVVERAVEALQTWDMETYASLLAEDTVWEGMGMDYMPGGGRYYGKEAVLNELGPVAASIYDTTSIEITVKSVAASGSNVTMEWLVNAKTAYGRPYQNVYAVAFVVEDGLIKVIREYTDTRYAQRMLFP